MTILLRPLLVDLGPWIGVLLAFALAWAWPNTIGAILEAVAGMVRGIPVVGGRVASRVSNANQYVLRRLGDFVTAVEAPVVNFFISLGGLVSLAAYTAANEAVATLRALEYIGTVRIPSLFRAGVGKALGLSVASWHALLWLQRHLHQVQVLIQRQVIALPREIAHGVTIPLRVIRHAVAVELPRVIGGLGARVGELENYVQGRLARRLHRAEKIIAAGVLAGLAIRVITRHLPWARCSNVNRVSRRLCGMDRNLLDSFLLDTTLLLSTISVVEFAVACQEFTGVVESGLRRFVRELHEVT